ncbi:DUF4304 domain-containing protein [Priestia megaterium]|uniref:DUF4304 domain-containing protein n=1 Tax=Priestia megaterium TaxID=1404 RepID=UPI00203DAE44|nr:DUF4304 domain-containing protein [Priestia megaterium]MCM3097984.1 DUF4304 domain-containing protein [Priestia megaterium]
MSVERDNMINSLRKNVIPIMRNRGFKGSFPHFYRQLEDRVDLLMFQFSAWGGVLYIEISKCSPEGHTDVSETFHTSNKVKVYNIDIEHRQRLGKDLYEMFEFNKDNTELISLVVRDALKEAEEWWDSSANWWV